MFSLFLFNVPSMFITWVFIGDVSPSIFPTLHFNTPQRLYSWDIPRTDPYFYIALWVTVRLALNPVGRLSDVITSERGLRRRCRSHVDDIALQPLVSRLLRSSPWSRSHLRATMPSPLERRSCIPFAATAKAWSLLASASLLLLACWVRKPSVDGRKWHPQQYFHSSSASCRWTPLIPF